jgi:hypothetical protein
MGVGNTTMGGGSRELEGDTYNFGTASKRTFDVKTNYSLMGEFPFMDRGRALIGPEFAYGVQYAGEYSEYNRVGLELMLTLKLGYGDASALAGGDADTPLGAMGITQGLYAMFHGWMQRYAMNQALSSPQEQLDSYGLGTTSGGDRGSMANVPVLEAGAAFAGGMGGAMTPALRSGAGWYWAFLAAQTAGGAGFLFSSGDAGKTGGLSDLLGSARLLGFAIASIEEPDKRLALPSEMVRRREMYINLVSYALNTIVMLGGGLGGSDVVSKAGIGTNLQVAFSPDPAERSMTESTQVSLVPATYVSGGGKSGMRSGMRVHQSWRDVPLPEFQLFSQVLFLSPMFRADNAVNHATQSDPYSDAELNSDVDATLGLEWRTRWTRLYFGLDTKGIFGGGDDQKVGIGGTAGFDLTIPLSKHWALTAGIEGMAHKTFPKGEQFEVVPTVGVEVINF